MRQLKILCIVIWKDHKFYRNKNKNNTEINSNNYIEEYDSTTNECSILVDITQKKYFWDGFRKTFETFIRTKTVNETSWKDDDIITEKNRVCYLNYQKWQSKFFL